MIKQFFWVKTLGVGSVILYLTGMQPSQAQDTGFVCAVTNDNVPTTLAQTGDGPVDVFKWQSTYFRPPYTPMQRCQEVTERMNSFAAQGMLDYITTGRVNNQPVLCAGSACDRSGSNVLLTLRRDQNPNQVLQEINANRAGAAGPSRQLSGGSSSSSSSFIKQNSDGTISLNVKKYLGAASKSPFKSPPNNSSTSPIFNNNSPSTPSPSGSSSGRKW